MKDFTTVLTMRREKRAVILSQLREIHDGQFKRDFGTGESKIWRGRATVIAAVTPALDRHYAIFSTMGERFLHVRSHRPDSPEAGHWAIRQQGHETEIRMQCQEAMTSLFADIDSTVPTLSADYQSRIVQLAELTAIARTQIERNSFGKREIEYVPEPEANTRISKGLAAIAKGIASLSRSRDIREVDLTDALRVGLDCIPYQRRLLLEAAIRRDRWDSVQIPRTTLNRELEELEALGLFELGGLDDSVDTKWKLSRKAERLFEGTGLLAKIADSSQPVREGQ
jgi:hypothetical protein